MVRYTLKILQHLLKISKVCLTILGCYVLGLNFGKIWKILKNYPERVLFYHVDELASVSPHPSITNLSKINIIKGSYKKLGRVDRAGIYSKLTLKAVSNGHTS